MVGFGCAAILVVQIIWLICNCKRKKGWVWLLLMEAVCAGGALWLMFYFDSLPGIGKAPGLTYFEEVFYSLFAAAAYGIVLLVTGICAAVNLIKK